MKCPRCVQELQSGVSQCPHCSFSLAYLDAQFGEDSVVLERLTDAADCIGEEDWNLLEALLDDFEERFPQLFLAIYVGFLPKMTDNRQFAFWLLNRATVPSLDQHRPNENGSLLVLDLSSKSVSFTLGYFVEPYLSDHELATLLKMGHAQLMSEDYSAAFLKIIPAYSDRLAQKAVEAKTSTGLAVAPSSIPSGVLERVRNVQGENLPWRVGRAAGNVLMKRDGFELSAS
jgi:uncharacterized membrane protein YgcG